MRGVATRDGGGHRYADGQMAQRLAGCGMESAALPPQRLAQWLAKVVA